MPVDTVALSPAVSGPSAAIEEVVDAIAVESCTLAKTVGPAGGVQVGRLREVLDPMAARFGLTTPKGDTFAVGEIAWEDTGRALAIAIQAGRAANNNGALVSVLAAAARKRIDWLILVLPERYKNASSYAHVLKQFEGIQRSAGIDLDLVGVTLVGF